MSDIDAFIKSSQLKHEEIFAGVFKELVTKYPEETDRQHVIRGMIMVFEKKYPAMMNRVDYAVRQSKETRANEYASNDVIDTRILFKIPEPLMTRINMVFSQKNWPQFLSDEAVKLYDEENWFRKNFPRYCAATKY